ncbi:protein WHAT'S THIS FACTOR 1 homolog [Selaginella moellendorffii]|uniref:protein WHAT'S THIS FACTOR 1 homolog n=1 Tax=Selaginella moellendorffii TaxID=88036 RepID=UPI000D1C20BC|nr:protein WHAT'S THIS FACTOR 1 homolog [Selaginella moellendorffii]XP_024518873.1 protein WHAT'S THIS FACTOR 1 homolog [Selaginella moellendorffii]XP_024518874.1 protein WHAT'S THIS FACTOR 1 homolog [Selaginella moellendorffii]XP_024518875.1 protein WHAT'S THIS FACTOR 1 homolog [Selaginella moellendorffii]XP_024518876.1 protein WHAT'S THIS FACTOR 1 homolog [Selaginella moellendorffii]|eukprot:XP_024518872.1 protein WHAT'S THIS FACTOR 1 homolog [Selaginella moellendorffii]
MLAVALPLESTLFLNSKKQQLRASSSSTFFSGAGGNRRNFIAIPSTHRHVQRLPVVTATVKRTKDYVLDKVVEREKKVKVVNKVKNILVKQPGKVMSLRDLGRYRHYIGLQAKRRFVSLLRKFPGVFIIFEEGAGCMYCRLTASAEAQYKEEMELRKQLEDSAVFRLRKFLMMSVDRRILVSKIIHLRHDLGLSDGFHTQFPAKYPEYFKLVDTAMGPALEVNKWDPELAVTFEQKKLEATPQEDYEEITVSGRVPKFPRLTLPRGYKLPRKEKEKLLKFQQVPLLSPYDDSRDLNPASKQAEKRAVALVQELLHLTLEKKTLVDHLTHFRSDFKFSQRLRGMLIRHPEIFYVSFKGQRDSVFLREAYNENSQLLEKDPLVLAKEKLAALVKIDKSAMKVLDESESGSEDDDGSWSDDEDMSPETREFLEERRRRREVMIALRPKVEPW